MIRKTLTSAQYGTLTDTYTYDALDMLTGYAGYDGYTQQFTYDANVMEGSSVVILFARWQKNKYNNYETSAYYGEAHKIHLTDTYEFKPMDLVFVRYKGNNSFGHVMIVAGYDSENKPIFFQRGPEFNYENYDHFIERYTADGGYNGREIDYLTVLTLDDLKNRIGGK